MYTEHTDNIGHNYSPDGEEIKQAVRDLDETLLYLQEQLETLGLADEGNWDKLNGNDNAN